MACLFEAVADFLRADGVGPVGIAVDARQQGSGLLEEVVADVELGDEGQSVGVVEAFGQGLDARQVHSAGKGVEKLALAPEQVVEAVKVADVVGRQIFEACVGVVGAFDFREHLVHLLLLGRHGVDGGVAGRCGCCAQGQNYGIFVAVAEERQALHGRGDGAFGVGRGHGTVFGGEGHEPGGHVVEEGELFHRSERRHVDVAAFGLYLAHFAEFVAEAVAIQQVFPVGIGAFGQAFDVKRRAFGEFPAHFGGQFAQGGEDVVGEASGNPFGVARAHQFDGGVAQIVVPAGRFLCGGQCGAHTAGHRPAAVAEHGQEEAGGGTYGNGRFGIGRGREYFQQQGQAGGVEEFHRSQREGADGHGAVGVGDGLGGDGLCHGGGVGRRQGMCHPQAPEQGGCQCLGVDGATRVGNRGYVGGQAARFGFESGDVGCYGTRAGGKGACGAVI